MTYVPANKLTMKIVPTTMGSYSDGRRAGASHYAPTHGFGDAGDGLGGIWDAVGAAIGGAANYVKGTQNPPPTVPVQVDSGISTSTVLLFAALGLGGYFVYKKMKKRR